MRLSDFLKADAIEVRLESPTKRDLFENALHHLHERGYVTDPAKVLQDLQIREEIMSTGIGQGVAIPHAQSEGVPRTHLSVWRPQQPVEFEAMDDQPVDLVFMILGPRGIGNEHVKILAKISRLLHGSGFRERLREARDAETILATIREFEEH
jgi:fructose-specific phosphotransferase system IIA component